jgi:hypothetical protein
MTLGIGIGVSVLFPQISLPMIGLTLAAVAVMSWSDIIDEKFIKNVLAPSRADVGPDLKNDSKNLQNLLTDKRLFNEVSEDLRTADKILADIIAMQSTLPEDEKSVLVFTNEYIGKLVRRLIKLSQLEQRARQYLSTQNVTELEKRIEAVADQSKSAEDTVAKKEYTTTLALLKDQRQLIKNVTRRLERIESYILRINTTLENTYAQMNKILLKDDHQIVDEGEILNDSLKKIVQDIDTFEQQTVDIAQSLDEVDTEKSKNSSVSTPI